RVGFRHRPDLGESFPAEPDGDGTDRAHLTPARIGPAAPDLLHHAGGVRDGLGVRHRVHAREPARGRGPGSARDGLRILPAGFAQVGVQVDEAGQRDEPDGVDDLGAARSKPGTDRGDRAAVDADVHRFPAEWAALADEVSGHRRVLSAGAPASNRYSTAIRTATPLVTCSVMTARGESAACAEISNPRFIGPGCMMIARSPRRWARALSSP